MIRKVAHFVRKSTQYKSTFIKNQIVNHTKYTPVLIFKYASSKDDGGFANFNLDHYKHLNLSRTKSKVINYINKILLRLSHTDIDEILRYLLKEKIDIMHFHFGSDACIYFMIMKRSKIPSIVSFYGWDCSKFPKLLFNYGKRSLQNKVFKYGTLMLAMSEDMKNDLIDLGCPPEKIIIHYHGIDIRKFIIKRNYPEKKKVKLLTLGRIDKTKGHIFTLMSLRSLIEKGIMNFEYRIVGSGPTLDVVKKKVTQWKLEEWVHIIGKVEYGSNQMMDEYLNADIFIHPSVTGEKGRKEGIPGTIVEAMAGGLPVIATYHAGIPSIITNNINGLLVNENDVTALCQAIIKLIQSASLRKKLGIAGQDYAKNNLNVFDKEKELEKIYEAYLNSR